MTEVAAAQAEAEAVEEEPKGTERMLRQFMRN